MHIFVLGGIVMKRKFVLMVPLAVVTLWANSFGVLVNAQDFNEVKGQANNAIWQQADQNKDKAVKNREGNQPKVAAPINNQQNQVKPGNEPGAEPVKVTKDKAQTKVNADVKEKRRVALANDYEQRKAKDGNMVKPRGEQKVQPDANKPMPPKKEAKKPAPVKPDQNSEKGPQNPPAPQAGLFMNA